MLATGPPGKAPVFKRFIFIYLATGGTQTGSPTLVADVGSSFPDQGTNPGSLLWQHRVLATEPPKKSLHYDFEISLI